MLRRYTLLRDAKRARASRTDVGLQIQRIEMEAAQRPRGVARCMQAELDHLAGVSGCRVKREADPGAGQVAVVVGPGFQGLENGAAHAAQLQLDPVATVGGFAAPDEAGVAGNT